MPDHETLEDLVNSMSDAELSWTLTSLEAKKWCVEVYNIFVLMGAVLCYETEKLKETMAAFVGSEPSTREQLLDLARLWDTLVSEEMLRFVLSGMLKTLDGMGLTKEQCRTLLDGHAAQVEVFARVINNALNMFLHKDVENPVDVFAAANAHN